jgi:hypothetical protein
MRTNSVQTHILAIRRSVDSRGSAYLAPEQVRGSDLGLACTEDGLFLGRTALVERRGGFYAVRPKGDLKRLFSHAYGADIGVDRLLPGLATVASALAKNNLCLAQIAAVRLRLPNLPDAITRAGLEAEDLMIKRGRGDARFARAAWDDAEHPRTGAAPNPGWFAPKSGPSEHGRPTQVGQRGRGEREPEDILDPMGLVRQTMWDARISLLRRIDPDTRT